MQQTGLADAHVADYYVFKNIRVVVRTGCVGHFVVVGGGGGV